MNFDVCRRDQHLSRARRTAASRSSDGRHSYGAGCKNQNCRPRTARCVTATKATTAATATTTTTTATIAAAALNAASAAQLLLVPRNQPLSSDLICCCNCCYNLGKKKKTKHKTKPRLPTSSTNGTKQASEDDKNARQSRAPAAALGVILVASMLITLVLGGGSAVCGISQPSSRQNRNIQQKAAPLLAYKSILVTRYCEWKSNLFVPKPNDVHFGSNYLSGADASAAPGGDASSLSSSSAAPSSSSSTGGYYESSGELSERKALVLSLPVLLGSSFAGYEPACAIRLIVPKSMRILAKLTSRKLSFAPQLDFDFASAEPTLWLNVSYDALRDAQQLTFESPANVLAFRFLLERFAHKSTPAIRLHVVATAFQTLGDQSGFNGAPQTQHAGNTSAHAQFICDGQRLIAPELACDGYKNCVDGYDEHADVCPLVAEAGLDAPAVGLGMRAPAAGSGSSSGSAATGPSTPPQLGTGKAALVGLVLAALFVALALAACCCLCVYAALAVWATLVAHPSPDDDDEKRRKQSAFRLIANQLRRNRKSLAGVARPGTSEEAQNRANERLLAAAPRPPTRLQSILKRPALSRGSQLQQSYPSPASQSAGASQPAPVRGALASHLEARGSFSKTPTPRARAARWPLADDHSPHAPHSRHPQLQQQPRSPSQSQLQAHGSQIVGLPSPREAPFVSGGGLSGLRAADLQAGSPRPPPKVTSYSYEASSTFMSEAYLRRLAETQTPPGGSDSNRQQLI